MRIKHATPDDFERVLPLLRYFEKGSPHLTTDHWRRLFHYSWEAPTDTRGFLLVNDANEVLGFEAFIQHQRVIDGQTHWIANGSSWVVLPEFRRYALLFKEEWRLMHVEHPGLTSTGLTAKKEFAMHNMLKGGGLIDTHQYVFPPILERKGTFWKASTDRDHFWERLSDTDRQIFLDHRNLPCTHLVVWRGDESCYLVVGKRPGPKRLSSAFVFYLSDPDVFLKALDRIKIALFLALGTVWITVDERFLKDRKPRRARRLELSAIRTYRSELIRPNQIDNLYSELVLLEL